MSRAGVPSARLSNTHLKGTLIMTKASVTTKIVAFLYF
jgi:hypothetical protein